MTKSAVVWPKSIVVDSGVLVAAIDADEKAHSWAVDALYRPGLFFTCEACIAEATHILDNNARAIDSLRRLLRAIRIVELSRATDALLSDVVKFAPRMDYADACVVHIVRQTPGSFALTIDHRDFSTYRIPFASPRGVFVAN